MTTHVAAYQYALHNESSQAIGEDTARDTIFSANHHAKAQTGPPQAMFTGHYQCAVWPELPGACRVHNFGLVFGICLPVIAAVVIIGTWLTMSAQRKQDARLAARRAARHGSQA